MRRYSDAQTESVPHGMLINAHRGCAQVPLFFARLEVAASVLGTG